MKSPNHRPAPLGKQEICGEAFFAAHRRSLVASLFVVHVVATLFFFPPADIVNERPVVTLDHAFHYYQAWRAREVFLHSGQLHAYDPYFMAGFPSALFDLDVKSLEAFSAVFPQSQVPRATKIYILACYLSMVFTVYGGCRLLRLTERESILSVALLLVVWHWGRPYASHFRYAGMFDFVLVSHLSIFVAGLLHRFLEGRGVVWWLVLGPLAYFIHPTAVVILSVPYTCVIVCARRSITPRVLLLFLLWCLVVVAVNSVWIIPLLEYASLKTVTKAYFQIAGFGDLSRVLFRPGCLPAIALVALAAPGAWWLARRGRRPEAVTIGLSVVFLFLVAAYGVFIPGIEHLEPGRFLLTAIFFCAPLAGAGAAAVLNGWARISRRVPKGDALVPLALVVLAVSPIALSSLSARTGYHHRLRTSFTGEVQDLVGAIQRHVDSSGRLMIEDGPAALYGESHLPGVLPVYTGVEQIGGPYPFTFIKQHFATFQRNWTMGKPLRDLSPREFQAYADLYNVRWIVVASKEAEDYVKRVAGEAETVGGEAPPPLVELWRSGGYSLWRVERVPTFTGHAGDRVTATFNRIRVDLAGKRDAFVLSYHWDRGIEVSAPATVKPIYRLDDPVPFIRVEPNGATSIEITY